MPRLIPRVFVTAALVGAFVASSAACQDPCVSLAERICNCLGDDAVERAVCRRERIVNQQSQIAIDDADRELCQAKLDTCTCAALDTNDLDACGFAPVGDGTEAAE